MALSFEEWVSRSKKDKPWKKSEKSAAPAQKSFADWYGQNKATYSAKSWVKTSNELSDEVQQYYSNWSNDESKYTDFRNRADQLRSYADTWRKQYAGDDKALASIDSVADMLSKVIDYSTRQKDYYAQWDSRDAYDAAVKQAEYNAMSTDELTGLADQAEKELADYLNSDEYKREIAKQSKQDMLSNMFSATPAGERALKTYTTAKERELRASAEYFRGLAQSASDKAIMDADMKELENWPEEDRAAFETYIIERNMEKGYQQGDRSFTNARTNASELFNKYGAEKIKSLAESYTRYHNQQNAQKLAEATQKSVAGNGFAGAAHNIGAVGANLIGSVSAPLSQLLDMPDNTGRYSTLDPYSAGSLANTYAGAVRQASAEKIEALTSKWLGEEVGQYAGKTLSTLYQASASAIDNLARIAVGGEYGSLALAATGSFGQTISELSASGASPAEAVLMGIVNGGLEIATEKISVENLLNQAKGGYQSAWQAIKAALTAGGVEVTEEELSFLGSTLAEAAILRDGSGFNQQVAALVGTGMSYGEAVQQAYRTLIQEAAQTAIQSFLSGGMMSGATSAMTNIASNQQAKKIYGSGAELVSEAMEINPQNAYAQKMQDRLNQGKQLSGGQINRLVQQNEDAIHAQDMAAAQNAAVILPTELGETGQTGQSEADLSAEGNFTSEERNGAQRRYEASTDGKTYFGDEAVSVIGVASIKDGKMTLKLEDGRVVDANEVEYSSADEALVYETVANMGVNTLSANMLIENYTPGGDVSATVYTKGIEEAYMAGTLNIPKQELASMPFASMLEEYQLQAAYRMGELFGGRQTAKEQATVQKSRTVGSVDTSKGNVHFDGDRSSLNETQAASLSVMETVAKALGVQVYVFESEVDENGKHTGANGWYDPSDGSIHIDLYAGADGKGTMLFTMAHELTHFIKQWSPAKFKVLANHLMKQYGEKGVSVRELVDNQIVKANRNGRKISYDTAYEEVIADSMETMLTDGNAVQMMADLRQQDRSLWQKIRDWFKDMAEKLRAAVEAYKGVRPDSAEGKLVADMQDVIVILESLYTDALVDASENYNAGVKGNANSEQKHSNRDIGGFKDYDIVSAVYGIRNEKAQRGHDLVKIGTMPALYSKLFDLSGDVFVSNEHLYQNMVDKDTAQAEGRHNNKPGVDYHALGEAKIISAIEQFQDPLAIMESLKDYKEPRLVAILNEKGNDGQNLIAVMRLYADLVSAESHNPRNHVLLTIYEKSSLPEYVGLTAEKGRILHIKNGVSKETVASLQLAGTESSETLKKNVTQFNKKVKDFKLQKKILYSNRDSDIYSRVLDMQQEVGRLQRSIEELEKSAEFKAANDKLSEAIRSDKIAEGVREYQQWRESSGYAALIDQRDALRTELETLTKKRDMLTANDGAEAEKTAIAESGLSEGDYFRNLAGKEFGYTPYFYDAGYITPNGKMLNFSGEKGKHFGSRGEDHRAIGIIYEGTQGSAAMVRFMNEGNIRVMAETPGLDISSVAEPSREQYATIKKFAHEYGGKEKYFAVDISDENGRVVGNYEYNGYVNADRVVNDIKYYYANGSVREQSSVTQFLWSDRDPDYQKVNKVLQQENQKLKEDVSYLRELVKLQRQVTGGTKFTRSSVEAAAGQLMKYANAKGDKKELAGLLNGLYEYIASSKELTWDGIREQAQPAVEWMQEHVDLKTKRSEYAQDILNQLHGSRVYLDESQMAEAEYRFGSYNDFRKQLMGSITFAKDADTSLDSLWQELAAIYPDVFDSEITSTDMPGALADIIDNLRNSDTTALEYAHNREMFAQDLFHHIYDSYWTVSTLHTVADVKQKEIFQLKGEHIQRMAQLREYHREKTAQLKREHRQHIEKVRQEYRDRAEAKQKKIVEHYQKSRQKGIEGRRKTEMRHKIQKVVKKLNDLLLKETKDRHIPDNLKKAVAEALDAINMDTVGAEERIAKYDALIAKETDPDVIASLTETRDRVAKAGERLADRIGKLKAAYDSVKTGAESASISVYDEVISNKIQEVVEQVGNTALRDMSYSQLEAVYEMYTMVAKSISNANKSFKEARGTTITQMGNSAIREVRNAGGSNQYALKALENAEKFGWDLLKPYYAFSLIGSETLASLYDNVRKGEDVWAVDVESARQFFRQQAQKHGYDNWDLSEEHTFADVSGREFKVSLQQIMSLYAYSKREQADKHLEKGGFVFDSAVEVVQKKHGIPVKYRVNTANAYNLSRMQINEIVDTLSKEQRSFVDAMQDYLSTVMGEKGNEVSLALYDVRLFKEKNYFPLKSASQYTFQQTENTGDVKLKNSGFSKKTVVNASNPIILSDFMNVWSSHVNDMSMYHAFVLPLEDFNRVYNYKTMTSEETSTDSVKATLQNAYGVASTKYIRQMLEDINGGARADDRASIMSRWMGKFKKGSVFANASVVIQQPSAIARAAALIEPRHFIGGRVTQKRHKLLWEEVKKYAPVAIIKEMGYFDTNMGLSTVEYITSKEYDTIGEKAKAMFTDGNYRDEVLSRPAALADEVSWCYIWDAVKRETREKNPGEDPQSVTFLRKAGERFTEVVTRTQVYDSVLSRSGMMRSKDTGVKMMTAFMSEPTTSMNMVFDALIQGKRGDRRYARNAVGAVIASQVLNSILVAIVYAARDDDEDKTYLEKYLANFTAKTLDSLNPLSYVPFIKDIVSIARGYTVERSDMSVISDIWTAWQKLPSENVSLYRKIEDFGGSVAQAFGLPVKNIMRDVRAIWQTTESFVGGPETTALGISVAIQEEVTGDDIPKHIQLYDAIVSGDTVYADRMKDSYSSESSYNTAISKAVKEKVLDGSIDTDDAVSILDHHTERTVEEAMADVQYWLYTVEHPEIAVSASWFDAYYEKIEGSGIDVDTYVEYRNRKAAYSKKSDILEVIDAMSLTDKQKDALYFAEGWAESTLDEAPWH